jgi:hypothetical protein
VPALIGFEHRNGERQRREIVQEHQALEAQGLAGLGGGEIPAVIGQRNAIVQQRSGDGKSRGAWQGQGRRGAQIRKIVSRCGRRAGVAGALENLLPM